MDNMVIALPMQVVDRGNYLEISLSVGPNHLTFWSLSLCMLESNRINSFIIQQHLAGARERPFTLEIAHALNVREGGWAQVTPGRLIVKIGEVGIRNWLDASFTCLQGGRPVRETLHGIDAIRSGALRDITLHLNVAGRQRGETRRRKRTK